MPRFVFAWPQPNGDRPVSTVQTARGLHDAVKKALSICAFSLRGCTVFRDERELGKLDIRWNGPSIWVGKRRICTVALAPTRGVKRSEADAFAFRHGGWTRGQ
jgi:hypothetical protein